MTDRPSDRPVKSYLERYHDIKSMLNASEREGGSSVAHESSEPVYKYASNNNRSSSRPRREADPISLTSMDDESSKTLERWESRKERKMAEDPSFASRVGNGNHSSFETPSSSAQSRVTATTRSSRWAPKTDYGYKYDSPELNVRKEPISPQGDSSPLFNDVELSPNEGTTNVNPLSIHSHFANAKRRDQRKSSYAEGLQSFSNAISSAVARDAAKDYWSRPGAQLAEPKQDAESSPHHQEESRPDPIEYYEDTKEPEGEERYIGRRIRMGASDCCKRLACKSGSHDDVEDVWKEPDTFTPTFSSPKKSWHICAAILVCVSCVIATAFTVKYVSRERSAAYAVGMTLRPTISSAPSASPSESPSSMPSGVPTDRPTSERERLISEYLADITDGVSNVDGSPQFKAKMWLLYDDKLNLSLPIYASEELMRVVQERIKQRYALATLYYSMGIGEGGVLKGWLEGDECRFVGDYDKAWDGVDCDEEGEVRALAIGK
jgi:hypothetical protein